VVAAPVVAAPPVAGPPPVVRPYTPPPVKKRRRRGGWGAIVAVGLALALLIALIVVLLVQSDIGGGDDPAPTLDVPGVVGFPYGQAEAGLQALGFTVARADVDAPTQAPDVVLGQDPEQGRKLAKKGLITLQVSSPTITMPNVVGQTRANATQLLTQQNLTPNFVETDSDQPPGTVFSSDPPAAGLVAKPAGGGRPTVTVTVAREPLIAVPDITAQDPFAAAATLGGAGFQVTVVQTPSDTVANGKVIGTDPAPGTPLPRNAEVRLLISTGPALVDVPNVVGQPQAAAEAALTGAGFNVEETFVPAGASPPGTVLTQNPAGGEQPKGAVVAITIGR
jgi:eukaryotic-like serine/threonine-protein kinase